MLVDFRPHSQTSGTSPLDLMTSLAPVIEALQEVSMDLGKVRLVSDWVQYKSNFRNAVDVRAILPRPELSAGPGPAIVPLGVRDDDIEIAVDVRRSPGMSVAQVTAALRRESSRIWLEDWGLGSRSCVWDFNARYWKDLDLWEKSTGRGYEQALPGGVSDAHNHDAARAVIRDLFEVWDALADGDALPEELYVVELGVGNGTQAKVFLDEFRVLDAGHGRDYYRRLHYMMCDYSPHVLDLAREAVGEHRARISSFALDATAPSTTLGFLKYKVFLVYISNVYDNLPTDEVAQLGGRTYCVQTRAYLNDTDVAGLAESVGVAADELSALVHKLLRLGPGLLTEADPARFADVEAAVAFWRAVWDVVRLEERYVPLPGLDLYSLAPAMSGELLRPLLESGADIRMHVSNGAVASFADSLRLLHPFGRLVCHDLFVTDVHAYRANFRGPGKYEGSVVNWVNGPLLAHVGRRNGFDVHYAPFAHRVGGNIVTMTAQVRD